jgi:predicted RNA binding protein YcfA (HicA-like mRNA interferase family)
MTKADKLVARFKTAKSDFTWNELSSMLESLGYRQQQGAGSRVKFDNGNPDQKINLHKPHPGNEVKIYVIRELRKKLKEWRMI